MKKSKKFIFIFLLFFFLILNSILFCNAYDFKKGNTTFEINEQYAPSQVISGWINISLNKVPSNTAIILRNNSHIFGQISLLNLLKSDSSLIRNINYKCESSNCDDVLNSVSTSKSYDYFVLNSTGDEKVIGLNLNASAIQNIEDFKIDISSSALNSCAKPLDLDIGSTNDEVNNFLKFTAGNSFCSITNYSCYNGNGQLVPDSMDDKQFCQNFVFEDSPGLKLGAEVYGSGNATFKFYLEGDYVCNTSISGNGKQIISCNYSQNTYDGQEALICLVQDSGQPYQIYYENQAPTCGQFDDYNYDFSIFIQKKAYGTITHLSINSSDDNNPNEVIISYINNNYNGDCSSGCYVPIKFRSNINNQAITINSIRLVYNGLSYSDKFYDLTLAPSKITSNYTIIHLDNSNLSLPSNPGKYNVSLYIDSNEILKKQIQILDLPKITSLSPSTIPAIIENTLFVFASGQNITKYTWIFSDNTTLETTEAQVKKRFNDIKGYNLTVIASNNLGSVNKTFSINVVSPQNYLNSTFDEYSNKIQLIRNLTSSYPTKARDYIKANLGLDSKEMQIASLKEQYNNAAGDSAKYTSIAQELSLISLPDTVYSAGSFLGKFLINEDNIELEDLTLVSDQVFNGSSVKVKEAIKSWYLDSLNVDLETRAYSTSQNQNSFPLITYIKLKINPKVDLSKIYFYINTGLAEVYGAENIKTIQNNSKGFTLSNLYKSGSREVEIIIPGVLDLTNLPIYIFPESSNILVSDELGICNYNNVCDSNLNENWKNCRYDCKPTSLLIIWLVVLFFVILIAYVILQEWYKKHYEEFLFKDKNDLYNLVTFMKNAESNNLTKEQIFNELLKKGWDKERIAYSYNKFKGKRTGMWEIPIFNHWQNKKFNQELVERQQNKQKVIPLPIKPSARIIQKPINAQNKPFNVNFNQRPGVNKNNQNNQNINKPK